MKQNDEEHMAFEKMGIEMGLDLEMHPLHLLYLNPKTHNYLQIFKAGYAAKNKSLQAEIAELKKPQWVDGTLQPACPCAMRQPKSPMPQTIEGYKKLAERDLELIMEQKAEISKLKQRINKLEQRKCRS